MKEFDKDGDGKLSEDERKNIRRGELHDIRVERNWIFGGSYAVRLTGGSAVAAKEQQVERQTRP